MITNDLYHELLLEEAGAPFGKGSLEHPDFHDTVINASCGDGITLELQLSEDKTRIAALAWQGNGCVISQAAMSIVARLVHQNPSLVALEKISRQDLLENLGLEQISIGREKCLQLGLSVVKNAVKQLQNKQKQQQSAT